MVTVSLESRNKYRRYYHEHVVTGQPPTVNQAHRLDGEELTDPTSIQYAPLNIKKE